MAVNLLKFAACIVVTLIVGIAWSPLAVTSAHNTQINQAIGRGMDPLVASCTYSNAPNRMECASLVKWDGVKK